MIKKSALNPVWNSSPIYFCLPTAKESRQLHALHPNRRQSFGQLLYLTCGAEISSGKIRPEEESKQGVPSLS